MRRLTFLGTLAVLSLFLSRASAAPLATGSTLFPAPGETDPTGGIVVSSLTTPFNVPGFFQGSVLATVIANDPSNALGGLTFTYQITNAPASPNAIARFTVNQYSGFGVDASYQLPATGLPPSLIDRTTADTVGASFSAVGQGVLFPGQTSARLVYQTNATSFGPATASIIDSGAITVATLGPAVPEPASVGVCGFVAAMALARRRGR
jgi:hypothetical protein